MHFFGIVGSLMFLIGLVSVCVVGGLKLYHLYEGSNAPLVTDTPYFYLSLTSMIIGTQLFLSGFIGEMIARNSSERNDYKLEKTINLD
jgi:hypothetical protein